MSAYVLRRASWWLVAAVFLGAAIVVWRWPVATSSTCIETLTYPGFQVSRCPTDEPKPKSIASGFAPNNLFRVPAAARPPSGVVIGMQDESCADDRCYAQSVMGWSQAHAACARGARVGLISSGIDARHPAFASIILVRHDFTPSDAERASHWQGTALLALLAAHQSSGVQGLVPQATFLIADASFVDKQGLPVADTLSLVRALDRMRSEHLHVVLLDIAGSRDQLVDEIITQLVRTGTVVVMPAGSATSDHPAVISVAAVDKYLTVDNGAPSAGRVDLLAPGIDIWTALPGNSYGYVAGNSFAAAYVAAALAAAPKSEANRNALAVRERALALLRGKVRDAGQGRGLALAAKACLSPPPPAPPIKLWMPTTHSQ